MKLKVMVEVTHQGKTLRRMKSIEVPEKTVKLHAMICEDTSDLLPRVADDVISNIVNAVAGPAAQKLDPMTAMHSSGPPRSGKVLSAEDKKMNELLGLDLLEHIDKVDGSQPGQPNTRPIGYGNERR